MLLHKVTGNAEYCAPCAWSALTGMSTESWVDEPTTEAAEYHEFERQRFENSAPWYLDPLPDELLPIALAEFREEGRWALTLLLWDREKHAVALGVEGTERIIADNHIRNPMPLEAAMEQHEDYSTAVVVGGFRLVPDDENPFPFTPRTN